MSKTTAPAASVESAGIWSAHGLQPSCPTLNSSEEQMGTDAPLWQKGQQTLQQIQWDAVRLMCEFWRSQGNSESQKLQWIAKEGLRRAHKHCTTCEKPQSNCLIITFAYLSILLDFSLQGITVAHETGALSDIFSDQESQSRGEDKNKSSSTAFSMRSWSGILPKVFPFHKNETHFPTRPNFEVMLATNSLKIAYSDRNLLTSSKINFWSGNQASSLQWPHLGFLKCQTYK